MNNGAGLKDSQIEQPCQTIIFSDYASPKSSGSVGEPVAYPDMYGVYSVGSYQGDDTRILGTFYGEAANGCGIHFRHAGTANVLWADGHVASEKTMTHVSGKNSDHTAFNIAHKIGTFGPYNNMYYDPWSITE